MATSGQRPTGRRGRLGVVGLALAVTAALAGAGTAESADAADGDGFQPGAAGVGDPYFPLDGNGGYDVEHYDLDLQYDPATRRLAGAATLEATAAQDLSRFNLDLVGLTVRSIEIDGAPATWTRTKGELTVTPAEGLPAGTPFSTVVRYDGIPEQVREHVDGEADAVSGFFPTNDGVVIAGEPDVAATWFPANDHPADRASFTFRITVPAGRTVVANGVLTDRSDLAGRTTWTWDAAEPMATYLATATVGTFDLHSYSRKGIRFWDAVDTALLVPFAPRTGSRFAISGTTPSSYKRLTRTLHVPAKGGRVSFAIDRQTEKDRDFAFVEASTHGGSDWTTLRDLNGHTTRETGRSCPQWLELHPFLEHYQSERKSGGCGPTGSTGRWWAASGMSDGYETWKVDLGRYAGRDVDLSISYADDDVMQLPGVVIDDIVSTTGAGSTSFEKDRDPLDGWRFARPPAGTKTKATWAAGRASDAPPPLGRIAKRSLARQGEFLDFLSGLFGPYPFSASGAIVHTAPLGFALENQTRPTYPGDSFVDQEGGDSLMVHELAHQWVGDDLTLAAWRHVWLNEGFATYTEWLWAEHEGIKTAQKAFEEAYTRFPSKDPFWRLRIGDPGPKHLFDGQVYERGAMTLHQLRRVVGDHDFFRILRNWTQDRAGQAVTIPQFIDLAEHVSGRDLTAFFDAWLFTGRRPGLAKAAPPEVGVRGGDGGRGGSGGSGGTGGPGGSGMYLDPRVATYGAGSTRRARAGSTGS
jgi:hypothetical protein